MDIDQVKINALVTGPSETRDVEVKAWIDPRTPEGKATLVKAILALRNFDGGYLVIGFDDRTLQPLPASHSDILNEYHNDEIQKLVSKHASETFDISVQFALRDGQQHPVVVIASGIRTPAAVKVPVTGHGGNQILRKGSVFFRTLLANGIPSSAEAQPDDWPEIMRICMENREADIGRFFRRHLAGLDLKNMGMTFRSMLSEPAPDLSDVTRSWLDEGATKAEAAVRRWPLQPYLGPRPDINEFLRVGAWTAALVIDPPASGWMADERFYHTVASSIPHLSGWPVWVGTRSHVNPADRHAQIGDGWEAYIVSAPKDIWPIVEFQRWEASGRFYVRRLYDDDASAGLRGEAPGFMLDLGRITSRVAESMVVGLSIAKALGCAEESTQLGFAYRWTGLQGRKTAYWASGLNYSDRERRSLDAEATTFVRLPLSVAPSAVAPFVSEATRPLFAKFDGLVITPEALERCVQLVFERRT